MKKFLCILAALSFFAHNLSATFTLKNKTNEHIILVLDYYHKPAFDVIEAEAAAHIDIFYGLARVIVYVNTKIDDQEIFSGLRSKKMAKEPKTHGDRNNQPFLKDDDSRKKFVFDTASRIDEESILAIDKDMHTPYQDNQTPQYAIKWNEDKTKLLFLRDTSQ